MLHRTWQADVLRDHCTYRIFWFRLKSSFGHKDESFVLLLIEAYILSCHVCCVCIWKGLCSWNWRAPFPQLMAALRFTCHRPSALSPTLVVRTLSFLVPSCQNPISLSSFTTSPWCPLCIPSTLASSSLWPTPMDHHTWYLLSDSCL